MRERIDIVRIIRRDRVTGMVACLESYVENCRGICLCCDATTAHLLHAQAG